MVFMEGGEKKVLRGALPKRAIAPWINEVMFNCSNVHLCENRGLSVDLILWVAEFLGFEVEAVMPQDGGHYGHNVSGKWTGMLGLLQRNEADFTLIDLFMSAERFSVVEFGPLMPKDFTFGFAVKQPVHRFPQFFEFVSFGKKMYWCTLISTLLVPVIFQANRWVWKHVIEARGEELRQPIHVDLWHNAGNYLYNVGATSKALIGQAISDFFMRHSSSRASESLILGPWLLCTSILIAAFNAMLITNLSQQSAQIPLENIDQAVEMMRNGRLTIVGLWRFNSEESFINYIEALWAMDGTFKEFYHECTVPGRVIVANNSRELSMLLSNNENGKIYALFANIYEVASFAYLDSTVADDFFVFIPVYAHSRDSFAFRKEFPYLEQFNVILASLSEIIIHKVEKMYIKHWPNLVRGSFIRYKLRPQEKITLPQMFSVFQLWIFGISCSILAVIFEFSISEWCKTAAGQIYSSTT